MSILRIISRKAVVTSPSSRNDELSSAQPFLLALPSSPSGSPGTRCYLPLGLQCFLEKC